MSEVVVDSSAIIAILLGEPEEPVLRAFLRESTPIMAAATRVEVDLVAFGRLGETGIRGTAGIVASYGIAVVDMDEQQVREAQAALLAYGKGRAAPPAVLNFGDLFAYALAKARGLPLLFKGEDFARTDIRPALTAGAVP